MAMLSFILLGRIPSKKDGQKLGIKRVRSKKGGPEVYNIPTARPGDKYYQWHSESCKQLANQIDVAKIPGAPIKKCHLVTGVVYFPDHHHADLHNKVESIMDFMTDVGIIFDDHWEVIGSPHFTPVYRKGFGGCEITLYYEDESDTCSKFIKDQIASDTDNKSEKSSLEPMDQANINLLADM